MKGASHPEMNALGHSARLAVLWNTGFTLFRDLLQFGLTLILVRLLAPQEYGQSGLVNSIIGFLMIFSFRSFVLHALQTRHEEEADFQLHFTAGAFIQSSLFLIVNLIALGLRWVPAYAEITPLELAPDNKGVQTRYEELKRKIAQSRKDEGGK